MEQSDLLRRASKPEMKEGVQVVIKRISGILVGRWGSGDVGSIELPLTDYQAKSIFSTSKSCYPHVPSRNAVILV